MTVPPPLGDTGVDILALSPQEFDKHLKWCRENLLRIGTARVAVDAFINGLIQAYQNKRLNDDERFKWQDQPQRWSWDENGQLKKDLAKMEYFQPYNQNQNQIPQNAPQKQNPKYQTTTIPEPPSDYCIQYIGGPKNSEQEIIERVIAHKQGIMDGAEQLIAIAQPFTFTIDDNDIIDSRDSKSETYRYKYTFLHPDLTKFNPAFQIIIAIFQA